MVIMGCGGLGATVATSLTDQGHVLHILDVTADAFDRLPVGLIEAEQIVPLVGDGTSERDLMKASIQDSTVFMALSGSDTQNALAAQIAKQVFQVQTVICRIDDPSKEEVYNDLGIVAVSAIKLVREVVVGAATA